MKVGKIVSLEALQSFINFLLREGKKILLVDYDYSDDESLVFYSDSKGKIEKPKTKVDYGLWWD